MKGISNTRTENLSGILSKPGVTYVIPPFQRDYSWEDEQWEELWLDIQELDTNLEHYMGYLVLQPNGDPKRIWVVDGQQRLTTLSILIITILRCLEDIEDTSTIDSKKYDIQKRRKNIQDAYIGGFYFLDSSDRPKLILNRHLENYYSVNIVNTLGKHLPSHGRSPAEKLLRRCAVFFYDKIKRMDEESLVNLVVNVTDKFFFTIIEVSDEVNAYRLFETLNARGLSLSPADLLKNYLFQILAKQSSDMDSLENIWAEIVNSLGEELFSNFLRAYWNSHYREPARKSNLYRNIRKEIVSQKDVLAFLNVLQEYAPFYRALLHPKTDGYWKEPIWTENQKLSEVPIMLEILSSFNVQQPYPLLLVGLKKLEPKEFKTLLRDCLIITFRYNKVCNKNPSEQEKIYPKLAIGISQEGKYNRELFKEIYPDDKTFHDGFLIFSQGERNVRLIKYILYSLDKKNCTSKYFDGRDNDITLEHIFPQNPNQTWSDDISAGDYEEYLNALGNLALLESSLHKDIASFEEKKKAYLKSQFNLTKAVADYTNWGVKEIIDRQEKMAKEAVVVWKLQFETKEG